MQVPLRITFILPFPDLAGGIRVALTYALRLKARGHTVTVISQPQPRPSWPEKIKKLLKGERISQRTLHPTVALLNESHRFLDRPRPVTDGDLPDADIVIATWWETAEWMNALSPSKGRKVHFAQGYEVFPYLPLDRVIRTYQMPFHRIAVSNYVRSEIETNHAVSGIKVVPISTDMADLEVPPRSKAVHPTIGFLYSTPSFKNSRLAIEAASRAREVIPQLRVLAFGASPPDPSLPLPDWVTFHLRPAQADIPGIYAACDAWLFTSEKEGFGLPLLEAMACGTPVLATRAGAAPDLIDGRNGWLLDPSPAAFAEAIQMVASMPQERWLVHSNAAQETARRWSWDGATSAFEDCLREFLTKDT